MGKAKKFPYLPMAVGFLTAFVLVFSTVVLHDTENLTVRNCNQVELVKTRIRSVVSTGLSQLGKKGFPGYDYYRAHPAELAKAIVTNQTTLAAFAPSKCS